MVGQVPDLPLFWPGVLTLLLTVALQAETGRDAWLRYSKQTPPTLPAVLVTLGNAPQIGSARDELLRAVRSMTAKTLRLESTVPNENAIILATLAQIHTALPTLTANLPPDAYWLKTLRTGGVEYTIVTAANDRGVLYGTFALLRKLALGQSIAILDERQTPYAPVRWINQWDNLNGTIERGYGGRSIFWDSGHSRADLTRVAEYGRLLASLGINGCAINNVNADKRILTPDFLSQVASIAAALRPWGVQTVISIDLGSPQSMGGSGGLDTFDPLDPRVAAWWTAKIDEIYGAIPDLGGVVMKADSEGRVGPSAYKRTHADAANVIARALKPHHGLIFYRGFVYDHHMDWNNPKNDRARAAYDNFIELDGKFDDNVIVQIKNGPIDFQVREPASPLFGALEKTNQAIELQITQEYMGQARHMVFLVPQWKETLDFGMGNATVKALAAGKTFRRPTGAFVGVANVGLDDSWLGNQLSQANLYGFGRLAWNPDLSSRQIAGEWTQLTFGNDRRTIETIALMQLTSWRRYENYTGPLGLQTLTDIVGNHYGVAVEASERNGWGQWHRADEKGVGMDRTTATGTGYIGQYRPPIAHMFESLATCPDDLLLFLHHVPYTYKLHSGKTVIQSIYDSHYEGADAVEGYLRQWRTLEPHIDEQRFSEVLHQLEYQAGQAQVWRDAVNNWFLRASGIPDTKGRVGNYPGRIEAEAMTLDGYSIKDVKPWEGASGGKAIECAAAQCSASFRYDGEPGWRTVRIQYFDQSTGVSHFRLFVGTQLIDQWTAADLVPARRTKVDSSSSTRHTVRGVALRKGDQIRIEGVPDGAEPAAIDYVEIR
jgi:alpha-glucuronidase